MTEKWYEGLPDDAFVTDIAKAYERAAVKIREGLAQGLDFDEACAAIDVGDKGLRERIIDDMLKVLIAEEHFSRNISLEEMAEKLKVPVNRLETAKKEMLENVKDASVKAFYKSFGSGNA